MSGYLNNLLRNSHYDPNIKINNMITMYSILDISICIHKDNNKIVTFSVALVSVLVSIFSI